MGDTEESIAFDAAWEHHGGNQPCPTCGERMDTGNRCPSCEPEDNPYAIFEHITVEEHDHRCLLCDRELSEPSGVCTDCAAELPLLDGGE